jgi:3-oxoacyl-[acyl-carrier protein] reductase
MNDQAFPALKDKVAVVTGGGRGIGAAIARRLAQLGAAVVVAGRSPQPLQQTATGIRSAGGNAEPMTSDVSQWENVKTLADAVTRKFGRVDILVNNAGIGGFASPLHEMDVNSWDEIMNTNLRGVFYCIKAFAPLLITAGRGDIVNISSLAGKNALPNGAAYSASKWGLNGLSYSVAEELRKYKIRVSVVCPGSTNTDLSPHEGKDFSRMLQPEDVAECVALIVTQAERAFTSEILLRPTQKP